MIEVVTLHKLGFPEAETWPYSAISCRPADFERYLEQRKDWKTGRWDQVLQNPPGQPAYLVTFDDGYRDLLEYGLPLLETYQVPALVFITTGFIDGMEPFSALAARLVDQVDSFVYNWRRYSVSTETEKRNVCQMISNQLSKGSLDYRNKKLTQIAEENGLPLPEVRRDVYLNWDEVIQVSQHPLITIGGHSVSHPRLTSLKPSFLFQEMIQSKKIIEEKIQASVPVFAYPHGAHNIFVRWTAHRAGYQYAFSTRKAMIENPDHLKPFDIPRMDLPELLEDFRP